MSIRHLIDKMNSLVCEPNFAYALASMPNLEDDDFIYSLGRIHFFNVEIIILVLEKYGRHHLVPYVKTEEKIRKRDVKGYLTPGDAYNAACRIIITNDNTNDVIKIVNNHPGVCDFIDGNGNNLLMIVAYHIPEEKEVFLNVFNNTKDISLQDKLGGSVISILENNESYDLIEIINSRK